MLTPEEFAQRELEILKASREYPHTEIGEAYKKWKKERGEEPIFLQSADKDLEHVHELLAKKTVRPCTQPDCDGTMELEAVCAGCVEGRKGYRTKWTCEKCMHRELSKKEYMEWLKELSSS